MSGPLAIAAVTVTLKDLLSDGLVNHDLSVVGSFAVSASPPDRITVGSEEPNQLNLFLYQVTPNPGWRNVGLPSRDPQGGRSSNPPLALDLHYLLSAYGSRDLNAEILLGYAMQLLHENPILTREQLRTSLGSSPLFVDPDLDGAGTAGSIAGVFGSLSAVDLADQVELIKITPVYLSADELSKLWTAMQARYRPSMAYTVSVVLIQATSPAQAPLPVLRRGEDDRGPVTTAALAPALSGVRSAVSDTFPAVRLGDGLVVLGSNLTPAPGMVAVLDHTMAGQRNELPVSAGPVAGSLLVQLPTFDQGGDVMQAWSVGVWSLSLRLDAAKPQLALRSNSVPLALAPLVALQSPVPPAAPDQSAVCAVGDVVRLSCAPRLQARQLALTEVLFGSLTVPVLDIDTPADTSLPSVVSFKVPDAGTGTYLLRLRVEGIDSLPVKVDAATGRIQFDDHLKLRLP
ncbi:DUF4255 domain-containing protein [Chitinimonas sp.]|uniref:DUF4255 domain-containing protein n=1 Tax=Chitinimonas sp. TaxID=1934313 RepID=UPI002F9296A2